METAENLFCRGINNLKISMNTLIFIFKSHKGMAQYFPFDCGLYSFATIALHIIAFIPNG